ncbi:MotE family protein [Desulfonatronovibrio magnus]|uniref:MotE family protein n=1 Tax=Desulfonatronovibrio magnus TaxID=698827 RepID=UPI0018DCFA07|nr:hypothetical protein [Desulfonatronovibrio magnus]
MKWQWSVLNPRPTKLLQVIMVLAVLKIGFMFTMFDDGTQKKTTPVPRATMLEVKPAIAAEEEGEAVNEEAPQQNITEEFRRLRAREEEIDRRERNLRMLEAELDEKLAELQRLEAGLERMLEEADVVKDQKIRHLVDVYANMRPQQAAEVLETIDENIAVKILAGMRGRQAGDILTHVNSRKAARLSELLTELQTPFIE